MEQDRVIALGFFDGVHRGHQAILKKAAELARQGGLEVAAVTFETHPRAYVRGRAPDLVCSFARRCALLQQNGAGLVVALPFDREMAETLPEDFAAMLRDRYRCQAVVCGENYHFGRNAAGRPEDFRRFGLEAHVVPPVLYRGRVVSSTYIRESVRDGKVGRARQLLGRPFFLEGPIVGGFQVGRTLDCPTINIRVEDGILMRIRNDGKPLDAQRLQQLREVLARAGDPQAAMDTDNLKDNLALINIQKRLLIRFGPACRLHMESGEEQGVEVSFVIPNKEAAP